MAILRGDRSGQKRDLLTGKASADSLFGLAMNDTLRGGRGNDKLSGGAGNDKLLGDKGNDALDGGTGKDVLTGGSQNDVLMGGAGADRINGGSGVDIASYASSARAVSINLKTGKFSGGDAAGDKVTGIEAYFGSKLNDKFVGDDNGNLFYGDAGNDTFDGGLGADFIDGGRGFDTLSYAGRSAIRIDLTDPNAAILPDGDRVNNIERFVGTDFDDVMINGSSSEVEFDGGEGADKLTGGAANDTLNGGGGDDILTGGDEVHAVEDEADVYYDGTNIGEMVDDSAGDLIHGGDGNDQISGGRGGDELWGDAGNDLINGDSGWDVLVGGSGNDKLTGGEGLDELYGGDGYDVMSGGMGGSATDSGSDIFVFKTVAEIGLGIGTGVNAVRDVITDFHRGADFIDLSAIDANIYAAGNQDFTTVSKFSGLQSASAGELVISILSKGVAIVSGDVNGDGAADFNLEVRFDSGMAPSKYDFFL